VLDAASEATADRIRQEIAPAAPRNPVQRPETQYDTLIEEPVDGPESSATASGIRSVWNSRKWWIVGGLSITAGLLIFRSK
jgi:hypothetical protein